MANFDLQEELQGYNDLENYDIPNERDISDWSPSQINVLLSGAVNDITHSSTAILEPDTFDIYRSLLKHPGSLTPALAAKLLDSLISGLQTQGDAAVEDVNTDNSDSYDEHKVTLEKYAFLLQWFYKMAEKLKGDGEAPGAGGGSVMPSTAGRGRRGRGGKAAAARGRANTGASEWTWEDQIPGTLTLLERILTKLKVMKIWRTTPERDAFVRCLTGPAFRIAEREIYMKNTEIRRGIYTVICVAVKDHGHAVDAQASLMQWLQYNEHLAEPAAEIISKLVREHKDTALGDAVLQEIAGKNFSAQDPKSPRVFSKFLIKLAEDAPRAILRQLSLLERQFDSESYPIRIAMVEIMGCMIRELVNTKNEAADARQVEARIGEFYETIVTRQLDLSSYVRTKVFTVLHKLCDIATDSSPWLSLAEATYQSLDDKVASVRKSAIALMSRLIQRHPYYRVTGSDDFLEMPLAREQWENLLKKTSGLIKEKEAQLGVPDLSAPEPTPAGEEGDAGDEAGPSNRNNADDQDAMDVDEQVDEGLGEEEDAEMDGQEDEDGNPPPRKRSKAKSKPRKSGVDIEALTRNVVVDEAELQRLKILELQRSLSKKALKFIGIVEKSSDIIVRLLGSTHKSEVVEAIEFFRIAHEWKMELAEEGIRKMVHLIWQKDNNLTSEDGKEIKGIRSRVLDCYRTIYLDPEANVHPHEHVKETTRKIIGLTQNASLAELTSLEEMFRIFMDEGQIEPEIVAKLWRVYSADINIPKSQRRGAIMILAMLALAQRSVVTDKADTLIKIGLGHFGKADPVLARYTCVALQRMNGSAKKVKGSLHSNTIRYDMSNVIFRKLQEAIERPCRSLDWFGMAEQAVNTIYALGDRPDVLCNAIIKNLTRRAFSKQPEAASQAQSTQDDDAMNEDRTEPEGGLDASASTQSQSQAGDRASVDTGDALELAQMLFVVGQVAIKHIVYLELVEREWKRQKHDRDAAEKSTGAAGAKKGGDEIEQVVGNAEDEIGDRIAAVRETELLHGPDSLLAVYGEMVAHIVQQGRYLNRHPTLYKVAILTLSKFLCISSTYCEKHTTLLFRFLELNADSSDPTILDICSNVVIALGDVAISFGTIFDENSGELYRGLTIENLVVKKNTFMVLTHLILNGMIKVKGQLGEMAKCLEDEDPRIADLAKLFFTELATKDNAIYNNLPDVISHLSSGENPLTEEKFESTMKYIFSFIEKERQAESIVDKLCQRFQKSDQPRQWRDIAFCLSLLPFKSERSVKKLIEGLPHYRDKLHEETVYARFQEILAKARSNKSANKPDSELNEFENILEEHRREGEEDQELQRRVAGKKKAAAKKRTTRTAPKRKAKPMKPVQEEDEYEE